MGGKRVTCEPVPGQTTFGRIVATCTVGGDDIGEYMLREGMAVAYKQFLNKIPAKKPLYLAAEQEAKDTEKGIWGGEFILPRKWRADHDRLEGCE